MCVQETREEPREVCEQEPSQQCTDVLRQQCTTKYNQQCEYDMPLVCEDFCEPTYLCKVCTERSSYFN